MPMRGAEAPEETRKGVGRWCRGRKCRFDGRHGNRQGACRCGESDFCAHHRTIFPWIIRKKSRHEYQTAVEKSFKNIFPRVPTSKCIFLVWPQPRPPFPDLPTNFDYDLF